MFHQFEFLFILPISFFLLFFFLIKVRIFTSVCLDFYYYCIVIIAIALTRISFCFKKGFFCNPIHVKVLQYTTCRPVALWLKKIRIDKPQSYRPKRFYLRVTPPFILSLPSGIMSDFKSIQPPKELDLFIKHIFQPSCCYFVLNTFSMVSNSHPLSWNVVFGS